MTVAVALAIVLQLALPTRFAITPIWLLPVLEALLVIGLVVANPGRISRRSARIRVASLVLIAVISFANVWSAVRLVRGLINGTEGSDAGSLLATGAAIWFTNVVVFALWYWDLDRGGPAARARGLRPTPDFLFPQMDGPALPKPPPSARHRHRLRSPDVSAATDCGTDAQCDVELCCGGEVVRGSVRQRRPFEHSS